MRGAGLLVLMVAIAPIAASSASAEAAPVGSGYVDWGACGAGHFDVAVAGARASDGDDWSFVVSLAQPPQGCPIFAIALPFSGPWTPLGGCVGLVGLQAVVGPLSLCLTSPVPSSEGTRYTINICERHPGCADGEVDVVFAPVA